MYTFFGCYPGWTRSAFSFHPNSESQWFTNVIVVVVTRCANNMHTTFYREKGSCIRSENVSLRITHVITSFCFVFHPSIRPYNSIVGRRKLQSPSDDSIRRIEFPPQLREQLCNASADPWSDNFIDYGCLDLESRKFPSENHHDHHYGAMLRRWTHG